MVCDVFLLSIQCVALRRKVYVTNCVHLSTSNSTHDKLSVAHKIDNCFVNGYPYLYTYAPGSSRKTGLYTRAVKVPTFVFHAQRDAILGVSFTISIILETLMSSRNFDLTQCSLLNYYTINPTHGKSWFGIDVLGTIFKICSAATRVEQLEEQRSC